MKIQKSIHRFKRLMGKEEFKLVIDVSICNLRCAMCPRGGINGLKNEARGLMSFELFKRIINKFISEKVKISELEIGTWGEPLLNPELPEMIRYTKENWEPGFMNQKGIIKISTNLNYLKNPEGLLESGVDRIRVSISGMTQEVYARNHRGGNIGQVLNNVLRLAEIKNRKKISSASLEIAFQDLVYNKKDVEMAQKFCEDNGLEFTHLRMYIPCVEDNMRFNRDRERLTKFYSEFIDLDKESSLMKTADKIEKCQFRRSVAVINFDGRLYRCCGVFEQKYFMGSFFDYKIREIPHIKSAICGVCAATPISWR